MDDSSDCRRGWRLFCAPSILAALVLFFGLWRLDFPKPTYDDLFLAGAGLNLASGGDFSNPLLVRQEFPSHYYFVQPPLHSYIFAGWLKIFGISATSVTALPMLCCFVIAAATILVLRRQRASVWLEWLVPLGVTFGIMYMGLRQELPAMAMTMAGFALTEADATRKRTAYQFTGLLLLMLGASAAPRVAFFIASLALYAGSRAWQAATGPRERQRMLAWWFVAGGITTLAFLVMIHFRLGEFVQTFKFHAAGRLYKNRLASVKMYLFQYLGYLQIPIVLLPLALAAWCLRKPKDDLSRPAYFIAGAIPVVVWTGGLGSGTAWWGFLMMVLLAGSRLKTLPRKPGTALLILMFLLMAEINRKNAGEVWGILSGRIRRDLGGELPAALALKPTPEHPVLVDGWVARYLYGYRLPAGVIDAEWCVRFPGAGPGAYKGLDSSVQQLRPGDIFLVGNYMRHCLEFYTLLETRPTPMWSAFGLKRLAFEEYPRQIFIIDSESCKGVRPDGGMNLPTAD